MILNRVQDHIQGKIGLSQSQVTAALGLLKKTISDAPTDVNTNVTGDVTVEIVRFADKAP